MKSYVFIIGVLFLVISALITLNLFYQQRLQMDMAEQFSKQQLLLAQSASYDMGTCLNNLSEESVALSLLMTALLKKQPNRVEQLLNEYFLKKPSFQATVAVFDKDGKIIYLKQNESPMVSDWKYAKKALALSPGQSIVDHDSNSVYILTPIYFDKSIKGVVLFENPIDHVADRFLSHIKSGEKGYAWMMDGLGNLLYHPAQPDMVGKNLYKTDQSCFKCHISFNLEKKIIEEDTLTYGRYLAPTGDDKILAFSRTAVGNAKWIVAVSTPYSEVIEAMKRSMKVYSVLIITIFITAGFASTLLIVYHRKKVKAEEVAKHEKELEAYAHELEQKVNERTQELTSEKEKLDTVVSAIGGGIVLLDKERKIRWANQMMKDMAGTDIIGKTCEDICYECDIAGTYSEDNIETIIISDLFGQKGKHFQITTAPVKGLDGQIYGYIRLVQDVTEMKRMEEQIAHSEKLASIGRLVAGIAHEIGNPLTSIFSFVQILRDLEDDKFKKENLDIIYFHINRISGILKQLSGFTKSRQGAQDLSRANINEIIEASVNLIQYDKKAKNISIKKELSLSLPEITVDTNQLSQVFVNLTLNAIDAMSDGGTLTVKTITEDKHILIQFRDTGTGIPKEDLHNIFDPFFTTKERGTGLGLAVSYNIIKKMGGSLNVESEIDKGSVFTVRMPLDFQHAEE